MKRTNAQNRRLFGLLNKLGFDADERRRMVLHFTGGRSSSSSELTISECNNMTGYLSHLVAIKFDAEDVRRDRLRKTLISFVYQLPAGFGFYQLPAGFGFYQQRGENKQFDAQAYDRFLLQGKHSPYPGRRLNQLSIKELGRLIAIMKGWVEHYKK